MPTTQRKLIDAVAKTALATLFTGPLGGAKTAANEMLTLLTSGSRAVTVESLLKDVERALAAFARGERLPDATVDVVLDTVREAVAAGGATVPECADLDFDAARVANRVLTRSAGLLRGLDPGQAGLCREVMRLLYERLLADPQALPGLDREFQHQVLTRLRVLPELPAATAAAVRAAAGAALIVDPRLLWRRDLYPETALVRAEFAIVPFFGRRETLASLESWCRRGAPLALQLFTGAGGMGKTRLMLEVCAHMRTEGWRAGFLASADGDRPLDELFRADGDVLVVIDYAESRRDDLRAVIAQALHRSSSGNVRIVALARAQGEWWRALGSTRQGIGDFLAGPASTSEQLLPLADSLADREAVFDAAARTFARILDDRPVPKREIGLEDETFERVLFLHLAALATVLGQKLNQARDLLEFGLRRERGFWDAGLDAAGLGALCGRPIEQAAALVTMAAPLASREDAVRTLARAPALRDQTAATVAAVAELLHGLYPGDQWLEGVQPDMLGEHLIGQALSDDPALLEALDVGKPV